MMSAENPVEIVDLAVNIRQSEHSVTETTTAVQDGSETVDETVNQIRWVFGDNWKIIFFGSP